VCDRVMPDQLVQRQVDAKQDARRAAPMPMNPKKCSGRCRKRVMKITVTRSKHPRRTGQAELRLAELTWAMLDLNLSHAIAMRLSSGTMKRYRLP